ncbi:MULTISPECIES: hypothetical protein [Deefgea]|uniref:HEAT repeat domain-containing protein n=1 Tax=Deefgea chitinilytica TaxID=570276 RepID=A0ABS2C873_9NEIS|nr:MULTISPECIES: hypothetical protein [Deefgea]MBM5570358.1 hypothetical protein [Deefgea chitinilytica]MBM9887587.1 hypothetical protein [Deefgea sp. CFH1-16]
MGKRKRAPIAIESKEPPARYQEWVSYIFSFSADSFWGLGAESEISTFDATDAELVDLTAYMLENCGREFASYSNEKISTALDFVFNNSYSDIAFSLISDSVPLESRMRLIRSIYCLYRDCFDVRCAEFLGHLNETTDNSLNQVCYMLWDISPIAYLGDRKNKQQLYDAMIDILEECMSLANPACVESALHGLGHLYSVSEDRIENLIASKLKSRVFIPTSLKSYAELAMKGRVQ